MYKRYKHAFDAFKTMVVDDGEAIFKQLEEDYGGPIAVLTPEVRLREAMLEEEPRRKTQVKIYQSMPKHYDVYYKS